MRDKTKKWIVGTCMAGSFWLAYNGAGYKGMQYEIAKAERRSQQVAIEKAEEIESWSSGPIRGRFYFGFRKAAENYLEEKRES